MIPLWLACQVPDPTPGSPTADTAAPQHSGHADDQDADGVAPWQNDCDDDDPEVHPGAADPPGDGRDTDCDGTDRAALDVLDHVRFVVTGVEEFDDLGTAVACSSDSVGPFPSAVAVGATQSTSDAVDGGRGFGAVFDGRAAGDLTAADAAFRVVGTDHRDLVGHEVLFPGDTDGDGRGDFVVTASSAARPEMWTGGAWVTSVDRGVLQVDDAPVWIRGGPSRFLRSGAVLGDVDQDGLADLLLAEVDLENRTTAGTVRVFAASSLDAEVAQEDALVSVQGLDPVTPTGEELVVGDLTGDGQPDLITGEFSFGAGGRVLIAPGPVSTWTFDGGLVVEGVGEVLGLGVRVALGDLNGDGHPDLVVSGKVEDVNVGRGAVWVFFGPVTRNLTTDDADVTFRSESPDTSALAAAADVDGDGQDDLVVGAPANYYFVPYRNGLVYVFRGPLTAPTADGPDAWRVWRSQGQSELFGLQLAACDLDHDGDDELVVGAPGDSDGVFDRGRVFVIDGGP